MSNSPLVNYVRISPNKTSPRNHKIDTITIHHMAGNLSVEACGNVFAPTSRQASSNYGIGSDGRIGMYVEEKDRSWCSSSGANDNRAITIEVANDGGAPDWHVSDAAIKSLIELCVDICKRNGIARLLWKNDKSLVGQVDKQNLTIHQWFAPTACPGPYLHNKLGYIADEVNKKLEASEPKKEPAATTMYRVQTGAYTSLTNANNQFKKVKDAGFDAYMVKSDGYYKIQVGAYSVKKNAENMLAKLKAAGFSAFITTKSGTAVSTTNTSASPKKKTNEEIAKEVIQGKWDNGQARKDTLTKAGYDYNMIQSIVDKLLK